MKTRCPNASAEGCPYVGNCYADTHHLFYPRNNYTTRIERQFRELPENKEQVCRWEHDEIHATEPDPVKPSRHEMLEALGYIAAKEAS